MAKQKEYYFDPGDKKDVKVIMWKLNAKQWQLIRNTVIDKKEWPTTFKKWQFSEKALKVKHLAIDYKIVYAPINLKKAISWCNGKKLPISLKSLVKYILVHH